MDRDANYFVVGLFVAITILAGTVFLLWVAGTYDARRYENYTIYFSDTVGGMEEGSSVKYKGIEVGRVTNVRLSRERTDLIKVDIEVDEDTPVRQQTTASLQPVGITGLSYIELETANTDKEPPIWIEGEPYPVIRGTGAQFAKLIGNITGITEDILETTSRINKILDEENTVALAQTLKNIESMTRDLNGLLAQENVAHMSRTLKNTADATETLDDTMASMARAAEDIETAANTINNVVTRNQSSIDNFTGDGLRQLMGFARESRETAESLRKLTDRLNEDPSRIIYKPSGNGVEIPR